MQFGLSQEQILLQDTVNRFLVDRAPLDTVREYARGEADDSALWNGLSELGVPALLIPESAGGVGLGCLDAVVVAERLGYHVTPTPFLATAVMGPVALTNVGGQEDLLAAVAAGTQRIGIAFDAATGTRADAGIGFQNGRISGKCLFALDDAADHYLVATAEGHILLVAAGAEGFDRRRLATVDATRRTCELTFERTPAQRLTDDRDILLHTLDAGRVMQAADTLGAAQCMLDQAVAYAMQREQFDRVIASFQAVKHLCAEMAADLEPCRSFVWYAGHALDHVPEESRLTALQAKAHLCDVGQSIAKKATEVHGGMGFTDLLGLHYWFKRIGANRLLLGSPENLREQAAALQGLTV